MRINPFISQTNHMYGVTYPERTTESAPKTTAKTTAKNTAFKGWKPENGKYNAPVTALSMLLESGDIKNAAVSGHCFPDGDSIGGSFAMAHLLSKKLQKPVDLYVFGHLPSRFDYLKDNKSVNVICIDNNAKKIKPKNYDLAVSVDTAATNLMNKMYFDTIFSNAKYTFKLDHHKEENLTEEIKKQTFYADMSFVDSASPSAAELVMQLVEPLRLKPQEMSEQFNNAVYTGILSDTRNFSVTNNPLPFLDTALLIKNGLKPVEVYKKTYSNIPKPVADLVEKARNKIQFSSDKKIGYLFVDDSLTKGIEALHNKEYEFDVNNKIKDLVNDLRNIEGVEFALLFTKRGNDKIYVSARSSGTNVRELALTHGGGGHDLAAGFCVPIQKNEHHTIDKVLAEFQELH